MLGLELNQVSKGAADICYPVDTFIIYLAIKDIHAITFELINTKKIYSMRLCKIN